MEPAGRATAPSFRVLVVLLLRLGSLRATRLFLAGSLQQRVGARVLRRQRTRALRVRHRLSNGFQRVSYRLGSAERRPRLAAWSGWLFLRHVLWDEAEGGFWRAQVADSDYYAHPPARRLPLPAPPVDRAKLADANAQAALALLQAADRLGQPTMAAYGRRALDFVLAELLHDGHLYHSRQGDQRSVADLPADLFWVLWAGYAVQARAPEAERGERLAVVAERAADWLRPRMAEGNEGNPPRTEVIALAARVCSRRERYPALPEGCRDWALRRLALRPETRPDWLIPGLRAWQARLEPGGSAP